MVKKRLSEEENLRFSKLFNHWFYSQERYKINDLARELGIPKSTIYDYLKYGKKPDISNANIIINFVKNHSNLSIKSGQDTLSIQTVTSKEEIHENKVVYQINELNDLLNNLQSSIKNIQVQISSKKPSEKISQNIELTNHINNLKTSLFSLHSELIWFKNQTKNERNVLRKNISANDIGYMTSLLRAIIKGEDAFSDWVLATNYQMEMLKWQ
jgi:hypothetical protein